jgi:anti-sigma factor RsiW
MHPDPGTLAAYGGRELNEPAAGEVARHLEGCLRCAREVERASSEWDLLLAADAQFRAHCVPPEDGLEKLLSVIDEWKRAAAAQGQPGDPDELRRSIVAQLELYFGAETAAQLERTIPARRRADSPIAAIEPLLTAFLGHKAAEAVIRRILEGGEQALCFTPESA